MPDEEKQEKQDRVREIVELQEGIAAENNKQFEGKTLEVLIDEVDGSTPPTAEHSTTPPKWITSALSTSGTLSSNPVISVWLLSRTVQPMSCMGGLNLLYPRN